MLQFQFPSTDSSQSLETFLLRRLSTRGRLDFCVIASKRIVRRILQNTIIRRWLLDVTDIHRARSSVHIRQELGSLRIFVVRLHEQLARLIIQTAFRERNN